MSRTPLIRRIAAIAVALAIPFSAASSAEAYTYHRSSDAPQAEQPVSGGLPDGGPVMTTFRSSWS